MQLIQGVVKDWNAVKDGRNYQYKHLVVGERNITGLFVSDTLDEYLSRSNKNSTPITLYCKKIKQGTSYCAGVEFEGKVYIMGLELGKASSFLRFLVWIGPSAGILGFLIFMGANNGIGGVDAGFLGFFMMLFGIIGTFMTAPLMVKSSSVKAVHKFAKEAEKTAIAKGFDIVPLTAD